MSGYVASPWGNEYHNLTEDEALGGGSAGPGKSMALLFDPLAQIEIEHRRCKLDPSHPHHQGWGMSTGTAIHLRRTFGMLDETLRRAKQLFPLIDPEVRWIEKQMSFQFASGYRFQFGHCNEKQDWENYMSRQFTHIAFDELIQFLENQYKQIKSRCRSSDLVLRKMLKVRSMTNPVMRTDGEAFTQEDPFWVRRYFVDPCPDGRRTIRKKMKRADGTEFYRTRIFLPALLVRRVRKPNGEWVVTSDNPDPDYAKQYEESLLDLPHHMRRALLDGDWYVTVGSFYSEYWNKDMHICAPFAIPSDWRRARSMDWGFKKPGCVHWWAIDDEGTAFCEKEFTFKGKHAEEVALEIREIERGMGLWSTSRGDGGHSLISGPADNQLWEERGDRGLTKADIMSRVGVHWRKAQKGPGSRKGNAQKFVARLKDHANGTQAPGIMFFSTCRRAISTIPGIPADSIDPECPADGGEDHWHDSVLYFCGDEAFDRAVIPKDDSDDDDEYDDAGPEAHPGDWGY